MTLTVKSGGRGMREELRDEILDAADRLLTRFGYRKMTVDDLAVEAGIGKGTVYLYFPSKQEVALCWVDRLIRRLVRCLEQLAAEERPAPERLRAMLLARVEFLFESAVERFHVLEELYGVLRDAYMPRRQDYLRWEGAVLARVLRDGIAAGELRECDPEQTARALLLATNSLLPYSLGKQEMSERPRILRDAEAVVDLLIHGLRP
ncbi:MAG TPA: TetR/AcrR family transcriptional regulator [Armatimonadota bacterium]|nr:TetR/AcrR family transcriptional regulator [Armatimonadota bacterium]